MSHQFPWGHFRVSKLASIPGGIIGRAAPRCGLQPRISLGIGQIWWFSGLAINGLFREYLPDYTAPGKSVCQVSSVSVGIRSPSVWMRAKVIFRSSHRDRIGYSRASLRPSDHVITMKYIACGESGQVLVLTESRRGELHATQRWAARWRSQ